MHPIRLVLLFSDEATPGEPEERTLRRVRRCWMPLIDLLETLPRVKVGVYLSGTTGEWMEENEPALLSRIGKCVLKGQIELLVGSWFGAALHLIPDRDAQAQLRIHSQWLRSRVGPVERSAWLHTGAWDPDLPRRLVRSELRCTMLDGELLPRPRGAHHEPWYVVERGGPAIAVLPIDPHLSAQIPWGSPRAFGLELRRRREQGQRCVTLSISVDSLGLSELAAPQCWDPQDGQFPLFLQLITRHSTWIRTLSPSAVLAQLRSGGRIVPYTGTSGELGRSLLGPEQGGALQRLRDAARRRPDSVTREAEGFLRGPPLETALLRWDEANRLHKRMLRASASLHALRRRVHTRKTPESASGAVESAALRLYRGQGVGVLHDGPGGLIRSGRARHQVWLALLDAEQSAWNTVEDRRGRVEVSDYDCDGTKEVLITTQAMQLVLRPACGGGLSEWLIWGLGNLCNTLTRTRETWYELLESQRGIPQLIGSVRPLVVEDLSKLSTIGEHRMVGWPTPPAPEVLEPDLHELLAEDPEPRLAFQDHFLGPQMGEWNLASAQYPEVGDFRGAAYRMDSAERLESGEIRVRMSREGRIREAKSEGLIQLGKEWLFSDDKAAFGVDYSLTNRSSEPLKTRFAVALSFNLDSQEGSSRWIQVGDHAAAGWGSAQHVKETAGIRLELADLNRRLHLTVNPPAEVFLNPVRVPSLGPEGLGSEFQGVEIWLVWPVHLWGGEKVEIHLGLDLEDYSSVSP